MNISRLHSWLNRRVRSVLPGSASRGFTLAELLVSVAVSGVVVMGIYEIYLLQQRAAWTQEINDAVNLEREQLAGYSRRRLSNLMKQAPTMNSGVFTFGPNTGSNSKVVITVVCEATGNDPVLKNIANLGPSSQPLYMGNVQCKYCSLAKSRTRITIDEYDESNSIVRSMQFPKKDISTSVTPGKSSESVSTNICFSTPDCSSGRCRVQAEIVQSYLKYTASSGSSFNPDDAIGIAREIIAVEAPEQLGSDITVLPLK